MKILNVAGARPNFMKISPIIKAIDASKTLTSFLVHTGQHYDKSMSKVFFEELGIPLPDINLEVGSGSREEQIQMIMEKFEPVLLEQKPAAVLVVGDVNSTIACATVAKKHNVKIIHVEAGLRSFDEEMPEEVNRVATDQLSDYLYVTEPSGMTNLAAEGIQGERLLVGNVMIDTLVANLQKATDLKMHTKFGLTPQNYVVGTFHRPSNVDTAEALTNVLQIIEGITKKSDIVLPMHPRTRASLEKQGWFEKLESNPRVHISEPLGYLEFISLVNSSACVVTDSGGVQEETTYLRIPCITMRENTERPITCDVGSNVLAGTEVTAVLAAFENVQGGKLRDAQIPEYWDGRAAERVIADIELRLSEQAK